MKVKELRAVLDRTQDDRDIVIAIAKSSIGPIASVGIESTVAGFDWDSDSFILYPNTDLVESDTDREMLDELKSICSEYLWDKKDNKRPDYYAGKIYKALGEPNWALGQ